MTATLNSHGQIVLRTSATDRLKIKPGDVLVVARDPSGHIILQQRRAARRKAKNYLTPRPLTPAMRSRLYAARDTEWGKVEAEAAAKGRRTLAGRRLEDL